MTRNNTNRTVVHATDWTSKQYVKADGNPVWLNIEPPFSDKALQTRWEAILDARKALRELQSAFEHQAARMMADLPADHELHCPPDGEVLFGWRFANKLGVAFAPLAPTKQVSTKRAAPRRTL